MKANSLDLNHNRKTATAWVYPGQGSQKLGMGKDLVTVSLAEKRLAQAEKILGWSVLEVCQNEANLSRTLYIQPCLFVVLSIITDLMKEQGYQPNLVAGYSLGEYVALYAAEVFDFETGLSLLKRRSQLMEFAPEGMMATLIGFEPEELKQQIQQTANVWQINDDSTFAVISGTKEAVESVLARVKTKRIIPLRPSKPFHTPLLEETAAEFERLLDFTFFNSAKMPVLSSLEPLPVVKAAHIKKNLIKQMTHPVKWQAISLRLAAEGIARIVEIAPDPGLSKQMKRNCPDLDCTCISGVAQLPQLKVVGDNTYRFPQDWDKDETAQLIASA